MGSPIAPQHDAAALQALVPALLDFERAPGRFALALREPRPLFDATHAVMLLAAGRPVEGLPTLLPEQRPDAVQQAARYFVRATMLRPDADHYTLLGLMPGFEPETLRDHYRLMIRLTHPDFAGSGEDWPMDAATRINIANDVLGSAVKRREYNATLEALKPKAAATTAHNKLGSVTATPHKPTTKRRVAAKPKAKRADTGEGWSHRSKVALAAAGALACVLGLWLLTPSSHEGSLVAQRTGPPAFREAASQGALEAKPETPPWAEPLSPAQLPKPAEAFAALDGRMVKAPPAEPTERVKALVKARATTAVAPPLAARESTAPMPKAGDASAMASADAQPIGLASEKPLSQTDWRAAREAAQAAAKEEARAAALALAAAQKVATANPAPSPLANRASVGTPVRSVPLAADEDIDKPDAQLALVSSARMPSPSTAPAPEKPVPTLTLAQVQPTLGRVLAGLSSGRGENVVSALADPHRPAAGGFVKRYQELLADQRVAQLGKVAFRSRMAGENLVVDGTIELQIQGGDASAATKSLHMIATFAPNESGPLLTQLVAATLR